MIILNDIHVGFYRAGGTTIASREAMRDYLHTSFQKILEETAETHCVIVGDLFDDFEVAGRDWVVAYCILNSFLNSTGAARLTLVAGNHDHSPKATKVSAFEILAQVLKTSHPTKVDVIRVDEYALVSFGMMALAHCSNQDIFDQKLKELLEKAGTFDTLFLHANFDNNFAAQSDHSLNVSREVAKQFAESGVTLVFAHEHQAKTDLDGKVVVLGNQWPTSIADCLGNDVKYAHVFNAKESAWTKIQTWRRDDELSEGSFAAGVCGYGEIDWQSLNDVDPDGCNFVKVVGTATASQSSEVMNAIAKFRQKSSAFVITNGVKVEGIVAVEDLPATFEATKAFDVIDFIRKHLDADEFKVVAELMDWEKAAAPAPASEFAAMEG